VSTVDKPEGYLLYRQVLCAARATAVLSCQPGVSNVLRKGLKWHCQWRNDLMAL